MRTRPVRSTLTAALFAIASTLPISALAVYEAEPNDSYNAPQRLIIGSDGKAMVTGSIGDPSGAPLVNDVDFYTFEARPGDRVTINIDGGIKGTAGGSDVDTILTLFGPDSAWLREADYGPLPPEPGGSSVSDRDAKLTDIPLTAGGTYTVAVTASYMVFFDGGVLVEGTEAISNGSYTLIISGVTPPAAPAPTPAPPPAVQKIDIDIKPYDRGRVHINPNARVTIPVALLSSPGFNPLEIDHGSVTFGSPDTQTKAIRCGSDKHRRHDRDQWDDDDDDDRHGRRGGHRKNRHDFNGDGQPDLVCRFENRDAGFKLGDLEGVVKGRTNSGKPFEGSGPLKVYPARRELDRRHQNKHRR